MVCNLKAKRFVNDKKYAWFYFLCDHFLLPIWQYAYMDCEQVLNKLNFLLGYHLRILDIIQLNVNFFISSLIGFLSEKVLFCRTQKVNKYTIQILIQKMN